MIANYVEEQEKFRELVASADGPHILMLQGESGSGKSSLIEHCLGTLPRDGMPVARLDLQGSGDGITTLFNVMGAKMGRERLPSFRERVAGLIGQRVEADDAAWKMQLRRQLREIGRMGDLDTLRDWHLQLTDTWFADAERFEQPLLVVLDTYEQRDSLFDSWFRDEFLYGVANTTKLRVLIGGQTVPEPMSEWSSCVSVHALNGVNEAKEWMVWGREQGIEIPSLEVMNGICLALDGNPAKIVQVIRSKFEKVNGAASAEESIAERRARMLNMIIKHFDMGELKRLCFILGIDHENILVIPKKSDMVLELVLHLDKRGRLAELLALCRKDRPKLDWAGLSLDG